MRTVREVGEERNSRGSPQEPSRWVGAEGGVMGTVNALGAASRRAPLPSPVTALTRA